MSDQAGVTVVIGLGEVGGPLLEIVRGFEPASVGVDLEPVAIAAPVGIMHVCIPFRVTGGLVPAVVEYARKYRPEVIVVNSTVSPGTTEEIEERSGVPGVYSPVRGKHSRMVEDMRRYVKFVAGRDAAATERVRSHFESIGLKAAAMSKPRALELAKLLETTYFGPLIGWAQEMNRMAAAEGADYYELVKFFEEVAYLPPVVFQPGVIGGHCVMQNIELLEERFAADFLQAVKNSNEARRRELSEAAGPATGPRLDVIRIESRPERPDQGLAESLGVGGPDSR